MAFSINLFTGSDSVSIVSYSGNSLLFISTFSFDGLFLEKPVYTYNSDYDSSNVIVALNESNTQEILKQIGRKERWLYLYEE